MVDEMINHIISASNKLAQKENDTRTTGWEGVSLFKKFKFVHTTKWYIHKLESVLENEAHKFLWDLR